MGGRPKAGHDAGGGGGHVIFRHTGTGVVVTVLNTDKPVRPIYVSNVAHQIVNSGISTASAFETRLEKAAREAV